jgi:predicted  nucleic acid-binding Zn-ribbon protein
MTDLRREIHLLVTVAKLDAELNACRTESAHLPGKIEAIDNKLNAIERALTEADAHLDAMKRERRTLEQRVQDGSEKVKKLKVQLMEIKTNKEYQAMLHEISHMEKGIDEDEEKLLIIMDELEQQGAQTGSFRKQKEDEKRTLVLEKSEHQKRLDHLREKMKRLEGEKPKVLVELDPQLRRRYDRILSKLHDFAVTHIESEICQGCHTRIPPQTALEVRKNDQVITCQVCGRILVHYEA